VGRHHLRGQHCLDHVAQADAGDTGQGRRVTDLLGVRVLLAAAPDGGEDLVGVAALGFLGLASLVLMVLVCRTVVFLNLTLN
jgi:hypothetical protein